LPKPENARTGSGSKGLESSDKSDKPDTPVADKSTLPFPVVGSDSVNSVTGVLPVNSHVFPSAIDIHGSAAGVLLHARKETRYDLLSPLSIWLEDGSLLVSVRHPSDMVLVATKFGDVCITTGGDALVERSDEDTMRVVNLCTNGDTVFLNMHDKLWTNSPWAHGVKAPQPTEEKGKKGGRKRTYEDVESGAVSIQPGYELVVGGHALTMEDVKPTDSVGRRDFRTFDGGRMVITEISIDNLTTLHDLIKNLNNHGEKASAVFSDIMKSAGTLKSKQGEGGFEKAVPAPPKPPPPKRKPPSKVPPPPSKTTTPSKPKASTPPLPAPAAAGGKENSSAPPAKPDKTSTPPAAKP
jgi:hypothetical protein